VLGDFGVTAEVAEHYRDLRSDPHFMVRMHVEEVFDQTPGPGAGRAAS
jgi:hypothetical protein